MYDWAKELTCGVTVCDNEANIIYINDRASETFAKYGPLLGRNLAEFHGPQAWQTIQRLLESGESNSYTIEKQGVRKIIHQTPWFENGKIAGLVELSIIIPNQMVHHVR